MSSITYSKIAEIQMTDEWLDNPDFVTWVKNHSTFTHNDAYEFIHHLFPDESENFYTTNCLSDSILSEVNDLLLEARRKGCARVVFYA